jgi:outer membrane protein
MKKFIRSAVFLACFAVLPMQGAFAAEGTKLGFVDLQKVLNLSSAGKVAKEQLSIKVKKYQDEINKKQEDLKKLKDVLEKQSVVLSEKARNEKEKDYQQGLKEFQRLTKDAQEELQAKDEELTKRILLDIEKVVQSYGRQNGYTFIFVRNESMLFANEKSDLTDDILKIYNADKK